MTNLSHLLLHNEHVRLFYLWKAYIAWRAGYEQTTTRFLTSAAMEKLFAEVAEQRTLRELNQRSLPFE